MIDKYFLKRNWLLFGATALLLITTSPCACKGDVVQYTLNISYIEGWPDGIFVKHILSLNKQFPGPTLEATVGDTMEILVINSIQNGQNTSLHWHGIHQKSSIFEDGVSMITQCPIPAGHSQLYRFNVTQAGTFWYHSHVASQYSEGLWGALIVHGSPELREYYGEAVLTLSDWYHHSAEENEHWFLSQRAFGQPPKPDSVLINGMGLYPCPNAILLNKTCRSRRMLRPVIRLERDKPYRIRLINSAAWKSFNVSIAEHSLRPIEVDGIDVRTDLTVEADVVGIHAGQRYSFLFQCNKNSSTGTRYLLNAVVRDIITLPSLENINKDPNAFFNFVSAVIECTDDDLSDMKNKVEMKTELRSWISGVHLPTVSTPPGPILLDEMKLSPVNDPAPEHVDQEFRVDVTFLEDFDTDVRRPNLNYTNFIFPEDKPLLHKVIDGELIDSRLLRVNVQEGAVVQLILNNYFVNGHPFHLHGHHFWIVGLGEEEDGDYDPSIHNLTIHGVKRDTLFVPNLSYAVIRFVADNPGVWLFHCHIDWHSVGGMALAIIEGESTLRNSSLISEDDRNMCHFHTSNGNDNANLQFLP